METSHYNHAFTRIDDLPVGPDYLTHVSFPVADFDLTIERPGVASVRSQTLAITQPLSTEFALWAPLYPPPPSEKRKPPLATSPLPSSTCSPISLTVVHKKAGVGVRYVLHGAPLHKSAFYAVPSAVCPEAFVKVSLAPQQSMQWNLAVHLGTPVQQ